MEIEGLVARIRIAAIVNTSSAIVAYIIIAASSVIASIAVALLFSHQG